MSAAAYITKSADVRRPQPSLALGRRIMSPAANKKRAGATAPIPNKRRSHFESCRPTAPAALVCRLRTISTETASSKMAMISRRRPLACGSE